MEIVFMGTPNFSKNILEKLIKDNFNVSLIITKPDQKVGRKQILTPSCVKEFAISNNISCLTPEKMKDVFSEIDKINPDIIITAAFGKMIPDYLLNKYHVINVHASILPKYRGGAPIEHAMMNLDEYTGVTIMRLVKKMDAGPIYLSSKIKIDYSENKTVLTSKLSDLGYDLLKEYLLNIKKYKEINQDESLASYAYNITFSDQIIDFSKSADLVSAKILALNDTPGAIFYQNGVLIKIKQAKKCDIINKEKPGIIKITNHKLLIGCSDYFIEILKIQESGKKEMDVKSYLNGQKLFRNDEYVKEW